MLGQTSSGQAIAGRRNATKTSLSSRNAKFDLVQCNASKDQPSGYNVQQAVGKFAASLAMAATVMVPMSFIPEQVSLNTTAPAEARLVARDPIKSAYALLRYAIPIDNKPIRQMQGQLERIDYAMRLPGLQGIEPAVKDFKRAKDILKKEKAKIEKDIAPANMEYAKGELVALETELDLALKAETREAVQTLQFSTLTHVGNIEEAMLKGFPFEVPSEYANLAQLKGRARLELDLTLVDRPSGSINEIIPIVLDGYNAPVTAGNFLDLVLRGFYDGMSIQRADGFVVQTGDPDGPADSFIDPNTGKARTIPLEYRLQGDKMPIYELNCDDIVRANDVPVLPFNAYGTMAMARDEFENNSASSQVFWLLKESELTPTGSNLLDGRFAVFGYMVENEAVLGELKVGDRINSIRVISGAENLVQPK